MGRRPCDYMTRRLTLIGPVSAHTFRVHETSLQASDARNQRMYRVLKSLLVFLIVAAFSAATIGTAAALPCSERHVQAHHESASGDQFVSRCCPVASEFARHPASQHETDGKCIHPCCVSTATAALVGVVRPYAPPR